MTSNLLLLSVPQTPKYWVKDIVSRITSRAVSGKGRQLLPLQALAPRASDVCSLDDWLHNISQRGDRPSAFVLGKGLSGILNRGGGSLPPSKVGSSPIKVLPGRVA